LLRSLVRLPLNGSIVRQTGNMLAEPRFLVGFLCGLTACSFGAAQMPFVPRPQAGPPEPPPITDKDIAGTWVGSTLCRGLGPSLATGLRLTIALDHVDVLSCKTHICEYTIVSGRFERFPLGQTGEAATQVVRVQGELAGRGVLLERFDLGSGRHVPVLSVDMSTDGANLSGSLDECGEFSLHKAS
jgi:hypothetical protein